MSGGRPGEVQPRRSLAAAAVFLTMLVAAISLWTAIPLSWIYLASKLSHTQFPSMGPYLLVAAGIIASVVVVAWLIARLNHLYRRLTGTNRVGRFRAGWLRSVRDRGTQDDSPTVVEAALIGSVVLAAITFALWFLLLAGSPLPKQ